MQTACHDLSVMSHLNDNPFLESSDSTIRGTGAFTGHWLNFLYVLTNNTSTAPWRFTPEV